MDVEKREPLCTVGGIVNWYSHYGKQYRVSSKILSIDLPYDPAIPVLGIYSKEMKTLVWKDICTPVFIAALFTITKTGKQPKCPSMEKKKKESKIRSKYIKINIKQDKGGFHIQWERMIYVIIRT